LISGSQLATFLEKYLFTSARVLAQHFLTRRSTIKEIIQRELGLKKILAALGAPFSVPRQNVAFVEPSTGMLRTLHESEENYFKGITTGDKS
jgi:hypothetical protein